MVASPRRVKSTPPVQGHRYRTGEGHLATALGRIKQRAHLSHRLKARWEALTVVPSRWQWPLEKDVHSV